MITLSIVVVFILLFGPGFVKTDSEEDGYSGQVKALFDDLTDYSSEVKTAKSKMNAFNVACDEKYAIGIINLYTQDGSFYKNLNKQMRANYPSSTTDIWRRAGDLINRGLDILGPAVYSVVYRGCKTVDDTPEKGENFRFNQITSTSLDKDIAVKFLCPAGYLFQIENVKGVSVKQYSEYENEDEVLIKSTNVYKVKKGPNEESANGITYNVYRLDGRSGENRKRRRRKRDVNVVCIISSAPKASTGITCNWASLVMFILLFWL